MNYGIFKNLASDNHYLSLTKTLNSARCTEETVKSIKRITKNDMCYAHMGQLVIHNGICYTTFLQNSGNDGENHDSITSGVVLGIFSLDKVMSNSFDAEEDVEFYPVGKKGDYCAGHKANSIFKDNSMCLVGDKLNICFSFTADDDESHIFCKEFNIYTKKWESEKAVVLRYKDKIYNFSDKTINFIYEDKGFEPRAKGLIELVSAWSEYKGEYYATGVTIEGPNNGFVVKTKDFAVMELVDVVPFNDMGCAEIASYIYKDMLFVACRQDYGIPYLYMGLLDLETLEWKHHYKISDGNSRPWFFEYRDELYLLNTVEEFGRRYTNVSRVRTLDSEYEFFKYKVPVETMATLKNCGYYHATANYEGDVYFVCTWNTESFGKLSMNFYDEDAVNKKMIELFE